MYLLGSEAANPCAPRGKRVPHGLAAACSRRAGALPRGQPVAPVTLHCCRTAHGHLGRPGGRSSLTTRPAGVRRRRRPRGRSEAAASVPESVLESPVGLLFEPGPGPVKRVSQIGHSRIDSRFHVFPGGPARRVDLGELLSCFVALSAPLPQFVLRLPL